MENKEIRLANMLHLAAQHGGLQGLAEKTGTDAKYLSQVKNRWNGRGMGDDVARLIEDGLGLTRGWMDKLQLPPHRVGEATEAYTVTPESGVPVVGTTWNQQIAVDNVGSNLLPSLPNANAWRRERQWRTSGVRSAGS